MTVPTTPLLFGLERSVYTRIARLALEEKGVSYLLRKVEIFGPGGVPREHLERHPFGRIPTLQHGDFSLYETGAISRYVDEAFPGPALQPTGVRQRARMSQAIGVLDAYAYRPMVWGVFVQRISVPLAGGISNEGEISRGLRASASCLDALDALRGTSMFLAGPAVSLADLHAFPMFRCFCLAPEGNTMLQQYPELLRWYHAMHVRESVARTTTSYEVAPSQTPHDPLGSHT